MEHLLTNLTASLTELREPSKVLARAGNRPVAILNRNEAIGYFVPKSAVTSADTSWRKHNWTARQHTLGWWAKNSVREIHWESRSGNGRTSLQTWRTLALRGIELHWNFHWLGATWTCPETKLGTLGQDCLQKWDRASTAAPTASELDFKYRWIEHHQLQDSWDLGQAIISYWAQLLYW